ncbi:MAG: EamA family transporter [Chlorobi bacterium]|nr:EamA family transporter [Chlorobiota bacterium]
MKIKINNTTKGYALVFISVLAMANVYIFSKASLNMVHISQFGIYWFAFGILFNILFNRKQFKIKLLKPVIKNNFFFILAAGLLELTGTASFFLAVKIMANPALVSFFANSTPVFVTILGILILKERFNAIEIFGIILTIAGSFVIAYNPGLEIPSDFYKSLVFVIISGISFSVSTVLSKKNIQKVSPSILSINRVLFLFAASVVFIAVSGKSLIIPGKAILFLAAGSFLGPFLAAFAGFSSLKYIEASRSSVIGSVKALFVLLTSYLYFNMMPSKTQIAGGLITVAGLIILSSGKNLKPPIRAKQSTTSG